LDVGSLGLYSKDSQPFGGYRGQARMLTLPALHIG
jgi:hypothetical protein